MCLRMSDLRQEASAVEMDDGVFDTDTRGKAGTPGLTCIYIGRYHRS